MKRVLFFILMSVIFLTFGCSTVVEQDSNQVTSTTENTDALNKEYDYDQNVPELVLEYNGQSVNAVRGTYSWTVENGDEGIGIEADSGSPDELIKYQEQHIVINEASEIHFIFDREPTSYIVRIWNTDNYELSKEIDVVNDKIDITENQPCTIYEVIADFSSNNDLKESGKVYYSFVVNEYNQDVTSNIIVAGKGKWLEEKVDSSDVIVIVSNQSFYAPKVNMSSTINGVAVFNDKFAVGDQHKYSYYYINGDAGEYLFCINAENTTLNKTIQITENETLWMYITYWNSENEDEHIDVLMQNEPIGLD